MPNSVGIYKMYAKSFRANVYTLDPFRMIGLIDVGIMFNEDMETVTLSFYRSSGTNSGKIKGLWYPIAGIKTHKGSFTEFTPYINSVLTKTTRSGGAGRGWLAKSLFFGLRNNDPSIIRGFSNGKHYKNLLWIGETLRDLYEEDEYEKMPSLSSRKYNTILTTTDIYEGNKYSQRENFEKFIGEIFLDHQ
ncbi:hypothetical protein LL033_24995 (plasmid) [Clostridium estertheticum]|uniref:hypothetical protein n=1 Tax=Clostridium estertheticum TaxID=238834 RepID=UPI001C0CA4DC|nr:hypothetical protein [Clostridium estertheticum]MBU3217863.1 hypothetical protein [Clostridium estertheticum]WAG58382.1 hypothetical protein LL033_24995 [Clostridium estertheticum]